MDHTVAFSPEVLPKLNNMGLFEVNNPWVHYDRCLEIDTLIYVLEGEVYICEEDLDYTIGPGEYFFLKDRKHHWGKQAVMPGAKWYWVTFFPNLQEGCEVQFQLPKQVRDSNSGLSIHRLHRMHQIFDRGAVFERYQLNIELLKLFLDIVTMQNTAEENRHSARIAEGIIDCLNEHVTTEFSSEAVAQSLGMNYSHLCRVFKEVTGTTINRYYNELRIKRAIELQKGTDMTYTQIGQKLGFANPYYFSRVFKNVTGFSPRNYSRNQYSS